MTSPRDIAGPGFPPLPPDNHVHTEWSWDTAAGSMEGSCARALELGLPAIAFTEHVDHASWYLARSGPYVNEHHNTLADENLVLTPPPLDIAGYLESVDRCRSSRPSTPAPSRPPIPSLHARPPIPSLTRARPLKAPTLSPKLGTAGRVCAGP